MHQDYSLMYPDVLSGLDEFWSSLSKVEKDDLLNFIRHVNEDDIPGGMSKKYWAISGAQILPSKISLFLKALQQRMELNQSNEQP